MRTWARAGLFVAIGAALLAGAFALSEAADPVYPRMHAKVSLVHARAARLEAVTVGNSHNRAVDFAALGVRGVHLWEGGQDVLEAVYLARYAVRHAPRLRYVLLPASFDLDRLDNRAVTSVDRSSRRREVYVRAPSFRFIPGDRDLWVSARMSPIARPDHWAGVMLRLRRPPPDPGLGRDGELLLPPRPPLSADSLARLAAARAALHRAEGDESMARDSTTPARAAAALRTLARELDARGAILVLYAPPYHAEYLRHLPAGAAERRRRSLAPLLSEPNVVWLDVTDPAFGRRDELFYDADHLNAAGARAFSTRMRPCLEALSAARAAGRTQPAGCGGAPGS